MVSYVSNLNISLQETPFLVHHFHANCEKIQYVSGHLSKGLSTSNFQIGNKICLLRGWRREGIIADLLRIAKLWPKTFINIG